MNDFFILSEQNISFREFEALLREVPDCKAVPYESSGVIQVWYKETHIDFTAMRLSEFGSEPDKAFIVSNNIRSIYMVSCNAHSESALRSLLSVLTASVKGWLGQDSEGFFPAQRL